MSTEQDAIKSLREQFEERFKRKSQPAPTTPPAIPTPPVLTSERLVSVPAPVGTRYGGTPPPPRPVAPSEAYAYVTTGPALSPEAEADMNSPEFQAASEEFFARKERETQASRPPVRPTLPAPPVIDTIVTPVLRCEMCDEEANELDALGCCELCASRLAEEDEMREEEDDRADLNEDTIDGHLVPGSGWTDGQEMEAVLACGECGDLTPVSRLSRYGFCPACASSVDTDGWTDGREMEAVIATPGPIEIIPPDPIMQVIETQVIPAMVAQAERDVDRVIAAANIFQTYAGQAGIGKASSAIQAYLSYLRGQFVERDEMIHAAVVAIIARQHAAYIGPAGSAKSQVIRYLMRGITGVTCASYQGNSFTTPDELIGQVSLHALERDDEYKRKLDGRMAAVELYELDEAFRLTNKAFNVLLRALNEREVFNPGATSIPLHSVMVASNDYPADPELRALRDRFAVKMFVDYVSAENFIKMMRLKQDMTPEVTVPWAAFLRLSHEAERLVDDERAIPERIMELLLELRTKLKEQNVTMSDRIMKWAKPLLVSCALLDGRTTVLPTDIWFLQHVLWDDAKDRAKVKSAIEALVGRLDTDLDEIAAMILSVGQAYTKSMNPGAGAPTLNPGQRINIRADATVKHDHMRDQLQLLAPSVPEEGALRDKYERISQALVTLRHEISAVGN